MTAWSTLTLLVNDSAEKYIGPPTGLRIDSGMDEVRWLDNNRYFALANGRYQHLRFEEHVKNFSSMWFNGVEYAAITSAENTGDSAEISVYLPKQRNHEGRADGMYFVSKYKGKRWPEEEREELVSQVEEHWGFRPRIEPVNATTPPDMVLRKT